NLGAVLSMREVPAVADPEDALARMLEHPVGGVPLSQQARKAGSACIVVCDITRPVPNSVILRPVLNALERGGIRRDRVTILVATGLHRPSTPSELVTMLGAEIAGSVRVVSHHAREKQEQRFLGTTGRGTPVFIDEIYCAADLKITTGFIEPHLMAGFSGGRKLIAPGCAGEETIKALHSPRFIEHPLCREGSIEGNPLHEELMAIARMAGHDFIVNVALDADRRITGIFAGDPEEAHALGIAHVRAAVTATVPEPVDVVVTSSAGYPLDLTLYQAVKGITAAAPILKKGGTLIIAAECAEGLGSPEFTEMALAPMSATQFLEGLRGREVRIDQWQLEECAKVAVDHDVVLVASGIPEAQRSRLFVRSAPSLSAAVQEGIRRHGPHARVAVIPKGPYTLVGLPG
ncbi:MAG: nickel-dependent lactate racemase, partial [Bacteroidetes bacterium]|nr:nickel-dependent lactate racemase [Bacteroidota bacterium]